MNITDMHVWFRQFAQQMGLQNTRTILPEQIDLLINTSISDITNQLVQQNIGITTNKTVNDNSKIGQINAFKTLYKVIEVNATPVENEASIENPFIQMSKNDIHGISGTINNFKDNFDYLFLTDLSLNYHKDNSITKYFPIRIIDDIYLTDTLNDYCLKPKIYSPVAVIYNNTIDIYINYLIENNIFNNIIPNKLRVSYINKPAKVSIKDNINCDLPEYTHIDILKHAVDLWRITISGALQNQQNDNTTQGQ